MVVKGGAAAAAQCVGAALGPAFGVEGVSGDLTFGVVHGDDVFPRVVHIHGFAIQPVLNPGGAAVVVEAVSGAVVQRQRLDDVAFRRQPVIAVAETLAGGKCVAHEQVLLPGVGAGVAVGVGVAQQIGLGVGAGSDGAIAILGQNDALAR